MEGKACGTRNCWMVRADSSSDLVWACSRLMRRKRKKIPQHRWREIKYGRAEYRLALVLRTLLVVAILYGQIHRNYRRWNDMSGGPPAALVGRWDLVSMQIDQKEPDKDDPMNWSWLDFSNRKFMRLAGPKPPNVTYMITWKPEEKKLTLAKIRTPDRSATFSYDLPEPDKLELQGSMDGKAISASLKHATEKRYELMDRGFHWIQELPYNR